MATVYLAHDLKHDRPVALKVLHPELAAALGPERFLREIRIAARLQHPHILPLHDSGEGAGRLWYTMPYVDGESLRDRLRREVQLPLDVALGIGRQIAGALDYAHQRGVIHRDIKPENVLLSGDQVLVADFGIAKALDAAGGEKLTETGLSLGTPAYMSPEQATASPVDARADIYSLGCIVYEMLTGDPPFAGSSPRAIMARHAVDPVPAIRTARPAVPPHLEQAISRALAKVPADRFATAGEFGAALELREDAERAGTPPPGPPAAARRRSRLLFVSGVIALAALVASALTLLRTRAPATVDSNLLAVAPFDVLDPSLELWREGLVDYLSKNLDGAGALRTVSPTVVIRRWHGRADPVSARALGRRTGARLVVYGQLVAAGADSVRLRVSALDAESGQVLAELERPDEADRMDRLADSLSVALLRELGRAGTGGVRLSSVGTRSLPALKAFLQGEQYFRRAVWDSASTHFERAVALDSTFALALRRLGLASGWSGHAAVLLPSFLRAGRFNHGLAPRDSLLIVADSVSAAAALADSPAGEALLRRQNATLEAATRAYPDDPELWYQLGEVRIHDAAVVGATLATMLDAFERSIAQDSAFGPSYVHALDLALGELDDSARAGRYLRALAALRPEEAPAFQLAAALLDPANRERPDVRRLVDSAPPEVLRDAAFRLAFFPDTAETALWLARRLQRRPAAAAGRGVDDAGRLDVLARANAVRGHLREAYRLVRHTDAGDPYIFSILALLDAVPTDTAAAVFRRWSRGDPERASLPLFWWAEHGDTLSIQEFLRRADSMPRDEASSARVAAAPALLALARRDSSEALRRLEALLPTALNWEHRRIEAGLLAARGRHREAVGLLEGPNFAANPRWVLTRLELARAAERLGDRERAATAYRYVAKAWRRADPELQTYLAEARAGLARVGPSR